LSSSCRGERLKTGEEGQGLGPGVSQEGVSV
jgi:hypothetical protein